jgi:hypothetical protein
MKSSSSAFFTATRPWTLILDHRLALARRSEADHVRAVTLAVDVAPRAVDAERAALGLRASRCAASSSWLIQHLYAWPRASSSCATSAWRAQNCDW